MSHILHVVSAEPVTSVLESSAGSRGGEAISSVSSRRASGCRLREADGRRSRACRGDAGCDAIVAKRWARKKHESSRVSRARTRDVACPDRAVVSDVRPHALAVVRVPQRGVVVLGAREHQVALAVVLDERQGPLVALQQNGAHGGARVTQTPATRASVRVKEGARAEIRPQKRLAAFLGSVCETYGQTVVGAKNGEVP